MARSHTSGGRGDGSGGGGAEGATGMPSVAAKRRKEVVTIHDDDDDATPVDTIGESAGMRYGAAKRQKKEEGQSKCRKGGEDEVQDAAVDDEKETGDTRALQSFSVGQSFYAWSKQGVCARGVDAVTFGFGRDDTLKPDQDGDEIQENMVNCTLRFTPWLGLSLAWGARDRLCTEPHGHATIEPLDRLRAFHVFHPSDTSQKPPRGRSGHDGRVAHEDEQVYVLIAEAADKPESLGLVNIYALELSLSDEVLTPHKIWLAEERIEPGRVNRDALKMAEDRYINSADAFKNCYLSVKGEALEAHSTPGTPYVHMLEHLRHAAGRAAMHTPTPTESRVCDVSSTQPQSTDQEQPVPESVRLHDKVETGASSSCASESTVAAINDVQRKRKRDKEETDVTSTTMIRDWSEELKTGLMQNFMSVGDTKALEAYKLLAKPDSRSSEIIGLVLDSIPQDLHINVAVERFVQAVIW